MRRVEGEKDYSIGQAITESQGSFEPSEGDMLEEETWNKCLDTIKQHIKDVIE
jgi:hypothetical protein